MKVQNTLWIALILLITIPACKREKVYGCTDSTANNYDPSANTDDGSCQYCPISQDNCLEGEDSVLVYQKIVGKWYLRATGEYYPHGETHRYCYTGLPDYLEFLANRTVIVHDSTGSVITQPYEFIFSQSGVIYNKFRILDSISANAECIHICGSTLNLFGRYQAPASYHSFYVKE